MWFFDKSILEKLVDQNIPEEKRIKIFKRNKFRVVAELKKLSDEDLLKYLFKSDLVDDAKRLIFDEIVLITNKLYYDENKIRFDKIKNIFREKYASEGLLKSEYCLDDFKSIIIDEVYGTNIGEILSKGIIGLAKKKLIVDLKVSESNVEDILKYNLSDDIVDYILDNVLESTWRIRSCIGEEKIPRNVRERIVERCITRDNIFDVSSPYLSRGEINVLSLRKDLVEECFTFADEKNILEYFGKYGVPKEFRNRLLADKRDVVLQAIKIADKKTLQRCLNDAYAIEITDMIFENRRNACYEIIKGLRDFEVVSFLNKSYLSKDFKDMLFLERKDDFIKEIKKKSFDDIMFYYLRESSGMSEELQKIVVEIFHDDVYKLVMGFREDELEDQINYKCHCPEITKLILKWRCSDELAFKLLSRVSVNHRIVNYILDAKKESITKFLEELNGNDLFLLKGLCVTEEIAERIISQNRKYIVSVIENLGSKEKFELLNNEKVNGAFKQLLLSNFGIEGFDVSECLTLLHKGNAEVLINNFHDIKKYITESGVDFKSLLQYGAGSKKHSMWLTQLANIILDGKGEEFNHCREYFFNNYYDVSGKENAVASIECFLELIDNYSKYTDLIRSLTNNNARLTDEDKMNLRFLFNVSVPEGIDVPKTLSELSEFKMKIYSDYIERINDDSLDEKEIKKIFNDLLFGDSQIILYSIGGTGALRTLKKDNINSLELASLIDEVTLYGKVIEMVNDSNNVLGLKKILKYVFSDVDTLTKFQNLFSSFEDKVTRLYEADSKYNLTSLDEARRVGAIDKVLSEKYGGEVFDFSDKNYALYAHVLSRNEDIVDILNGSSSGERNFISVSPISYRGQTYYYCRDEFIFVYDHIPTGSFIRSSISNMGSNGFISKNSSEVRGKASVNQRGILESSASTDSNPEALLYREGLKPCGIVLPGGRVPTSGELEVHQKYNIPFIVTQEVSSSIEDVKYVFNQETVGEKRSVSKKELEEIVEVLSPNVTIDKEDDEYTGREVAIFTDCHSMYEPTLAVLEDIRRNGITEIYSLGDNVGLGPNPCEVFDLLEEYGVISVAGNSEYYNTLGIEPFTYFGDAKAKSQEWTNSRLGRERVKKLEVYPASIDLVLGGERLALCHFANDVRWDYHDHSTHDYQRDFDSGMAAEQFLYTNSDDAVKKVNNCITSHKKSDPRARGYVSAKNNPLFDGKKVTDYDAIIQGHVHFDREDSIEDTDIHTLRAVGMGYEKDPRDTACYYVLRERKDGSFDKEKRLVKFNKDSLMASVYTSGVPNKEAVLRYLK